MRSDTTLSLVSLSHRWAGLTCQLTVIFNESPFHLGGSTKVLMTNLPFKIKRSSGTSHCTCPNSCLTTCQPAFALKQATVCRNEEERPFLPACKGCNELAVKFAQATLARITINKTLSCLLHWHTDTCTCTHTHTLTVCATCCPVMRLVSVTAKERHD